MRFAVAALALSLFSISSCQRPATKSQPAPSASAAGHAVRPFGAFDLASTENGAALITLDARGTGLTLRRFDANGHAEPEQPLYDSKAKDAPRDVLEVSEVAAASLGTELNVVWLEKSARGARARGLLRHLLGQNNGSVVDLNAAQTPVASPRGNVAIGISDGQFLVLTRAEKTGCADPSQTDCVGFDLFRQEPSGPTHPGLPLAVPLPCEQNSVSFAVSSQRWYYGVCSRGTGKPVTTLFSIQSEPAYARADRILEGCLPLGATALEGDLVVLGDCSGQRQGVRVRGGNAAVEEVRVDRLEAVCDQGRPLIRQLGPGGLSLALDQRRDRLEAFLPQALSMPQARAVWTGQALLVAGTAFGQVKVKSYRCDSTLLRETTSPAVGP